MNSPYFSAPVFAEPKREILNPSDVVKWEKSQAYSDYLGFILTLNDAVKGKTMTVDCPSSEALEKLITMLETLDTWIDEIPPTDQPQRFGNKAFRTWCSRLDEVLSKFPVIQHFVFGTLLSFEEAEIFKKPL
ncbi:Serine/threonine-protein phosphatase 2A activator [Stylophora pistillata]|uniref:Serine/threonine-protein phosphatase 2A activator n=1 Tax=Stylophora pistillata TaxID=50429 RepID=A0A2B4SMV5_STYPI|nr:Serine/threonine-protein phosphatase 2A activator [Stylophora pistillata]